MLKQFYPKAAPKLFEQNSLLAGTLVSNEEWLIKIGLLLILLKTINTDF